MNATYPLAKSPAYPMALLAWPVMLLVSQLPDILFNELTGSLPVWLFPAKLVLITGLFLGSLVWEHLRSMRLFFGVLIVLNALEWGVLRFFEAVNYQSWLAETAPFINQIGTGQIIRMSAAIIMTVAMLFILRRPQAFFLAKGQLDAPANPIPLIMTRPGNWRILGPVITGAMSLGLVGFCLAFGSLPTLQSLSNVLPLLPFVLLFSATNAYSEEMLYRAPWLAALEKPTGAMHALLITALYFGIGHYYGVPYGILGCIMAFIPGWLNGKAMLETRGFFWAWFIHFWMDVVIFSFIALGSVTPGG